MRLSTIPIFRAKPVIKISDDNSESEYELLYALQQQKHFLGYPYWSDIYNKDNQQIVGTIAEIESLADHLNDFIYLTRL
jgi:hypothetical protein